MLLTFSQLQGNRFSQIRLSIVLPHCVLFDESCMIRRSRTWIPRPPHVREQVDHSPHMDILHFTLTSSVFESESESESEFESVQNKFSALINYLQFKC